MNKTFYITNRHFTQKILGLFINIFRFWGLGFGFGFWIWV